jgi:hypothetical protein
MATIWDLKQGLAKVKLQSAIPKIIENTGKEIIQLNTIEQLYKNSIDSFGRKLTLYSSPLYAIDKSRLNPLPGLFHPDLYFTGDFYRGFYVTAGYTGIYTIDSSDSKTGKLEAKYGKEIFGLTEQNTERYATGTFYDALQEYITGKTGLIFR